MTIFTSHCDKTHCFEEVRDGTLDVRVRGNSIFPHSILGRFTVLCAILRQFHMVIQISMWGKELNKLEPEILFMDQLSACIPLLRQTCKEPRILFYCHFPDKLLAQRTNWVKSVYRWPFDWLESWSTGASDVIAVNSDFTKSIFADAFPRLFYRSPRVVHPCVDVDAKTNSLSGKGDSLTSIWTTKKTFLSINRFERKKDVALAIRAFAGLSKQERDSSTLVLAGGYDPRISENAICHTSLQKLASSLDLTHATFNNAITAMSPNLDTNIVFLLSVPDTLKTTLLESCTLLLYTPSFEHFGIVPLEAMLARKPVLAANTGGPKETVIDGETGWLRETSKTEDWTEVMSMALADETEQQLQNMGENGRQRVIEHFSMRNMAQRFDEIINKMLSAKTRPVIMDDKEILVVLGIVLVVGFIGVCLGGYILSSWNGHKHRQRLALYELHGIKQEL